MMDTPAHTPIHTAAAAAGRIRVLVAEDEENLAQILTTFLRGRGHHVVCLDPGPAGLSLSPHP